MQTETKPLSLEELARAVEVLQGKVRSLKVAQARIEHEAELLVQVMKSAVQRPGALRR